MELKKILYPFLFIIFFFSFADLRSQSTNKLNPLESKLQKADSLYWEGRPDLIINLLEPLQEIHSKNLDIPYYLFISHTSLGRFEDGEYWLRKALEVDPTLPEIMLGFLYSLKGDINKTTQELNKAIHTASKGNSELYRDIGILSAVLGKHEQAVKYFEEFQMAHPKKELPIPHYAVALFNIGKVNKAENLIQEKKNSLNTEIQNFPEADLPHYVLAEIYALEGNAENCVSHLKRYLGKKLPYSFYYGLSKETKGDPLWNKVRSSTEFQELLRTKKQQIEFLRNNLEPERKNLIMNNGETILDSLWDPIRNNYAEGRVDLVLRDLESAVGKYPDNKKIIYGLFKSNKSLGRYQEARKWLSRLKDIDPDFDDEMMFAYLFFSEGNTESAEEIKKKVLSQASGDDPMIWQEVALFEAFTGDYENALRHFDKYSEYGSRKDLMVHYALALIKTGKNQKAQEFLDFKYAKLQEKGKNSSGSTHYKLGLAEIEALRGNAEKTISLLKDELGEKLNIYLHYIINEEVNDPIFDRIRSDENFQRYAAYQRERISDMMESL